MHTDAWLAGLFEGEGTITLPKKRGMVTIAVTMNDEDVVRRAREVAGVGSVYLLKRGGWTWKVSNVEDACTVLMRLMPLLGERRKRRAREAIQRWLAHDPKDRIMRHGTTATFQQEVAWGLAPCGACREAMRSYRREYYRQRRGVVAGGLVNS